MVTAITTERTREFSNGQRIYLGVLLGWLLVSTPLVLALNWPVPAHRAVIGMAIGLIVLWVGAGGFLMVRWREPVTEYVKTIRADWRLKFVVFCTLLAMTEEAITTGMTNSAPLFGVKVGQAYITASANYFDVICLHSVIIFVSLFVGWAVILSRYDFSPFAVFVLFGTTGTFAETSFSGLQHVLEYAMWTFVYGLMVWLPARAVPRERLTRTPRWWMYPAAVFFPFLFLILFPLAGVVSLFFPGHPSIHFPPLR